MMIHTRLLMMATLLVQLSSPLRLQALPAAVEPAASGFTGTVVETTNAASYTYVQVDTGKGKIWAAAPQFSVKVGEKVAIPEGLPMKNYYSQTLKRTFDTVYFVGKISSLNGQPTGKPAHDPHAGLMGDPHAGLQGKSATPPPKTVDFSGLKKAPGGLTIAELFAQKNKLAGNKISVRGKVVKYTAQIMGKNWVHIQDGTGASGANDLTLTTQDATQVGDTVLVQGTVVVDKDFGAGYKYGLLLETATVTVEQKAKK